MKKNKKGKSTAYQKGYDQGRTDAVLFNKYKPQMSSSVIGRVKNIFKSYKQLQLYTKGYQKGYFEIVELRKMKSNEKFIEKVSQKDELEKAMNHTSKEKGISR